MSFMPHAGSFAMGYGRSAWTGIDSSDWQLEIVSDNGGGNGAGTLRYGFEHGTYPRIIVPICSGVITSSDGGLNMEWPSYFLGQVSPNGIFLVAHVLARGLDLVVRHLTTTMGFNFDNGEAEPDSITTRSGGAFTANRHIYDHVTACWGWDSTWDVSDNASNVTRQYCAILETLWRDNNNWETEGVRSDGLAGGSNSVNGIADLLNLIAKCPYRSPAAFDNAGATAARWFANNVVAAGQHIRSHNGDLGMTQNQIANLGIPGRINGNTETPQMEWKNCDSSCSIWTNGTSNKMDDGSNMNYATANGTPGDPDNPPSGIFKNSQQGSNLANFTPVSATVARDDVLANAGHTLLNVATGESPLTAVLAQIATWRTSGPTALNAPALHDANDVASGGLPTISNSSLYDIENVDYRDATRDFSDPGVALAVEENGFPRIINWANGILLGEDVGIDFGASMDTLVQVIGVSNTVFPGTLAGVPQTIVSPTGVSATGAAGTPSVVISGEEEIVAVTGVSAAGSVGSVDVSITTPIIATVTGVQITTSLGTLSLKFPTEWQEANDAGTAVWVEVDQTE